MYINFDRFDVYRLIINLIIKVKQCDSQDDEIQLSIDIQTLKQM